MSEVRERKTIIQNRSKSYLCILKKTEYLHNIHKLFAYTILKTTYVLCSFYVSFLSFNRSYSYGIKMFYNVLSTEIVYESVINTLKSSFLIFHLRLQIYYHIRSFVIDNIFNSVIDFCLSIRKIVQKFNIYPPICLQYYLIYSQKSVKFH